MASVTMVTISFFTEISIVEQLRTGSADGRGLKVSHHLSSWQLSPVGMSGVWLDLVDLLLMNSRLLASTNGSLSGG